MSLLSSKNVPLYMQRSLDTWDLKMFPQETQARISWLDRQIDRFRCSNPQLASVYRREKEEILQAWRQDNV